MNILSNKQKIVLFDKLYIYMSHYIVYIPEMVNINKITSFINLPKT